MPDGALERPGATLRFVDAGSGRPVVFQHGLGGGEAQVAELFPTEAGRRLTLQCRGHGDSAAGPPDLLSIAAFADDVLAMADALHIGRFVAGGVSMGAAIAMRLAALHPERVEALVLVRPAWLFAPAPPNMAVYADVAEYLTGFPPSEARERFAATATARRLATEAPDNLASLLGFFDRPHPEVIASLLSRLAADGPGVAAADIRVPALVIGNDADCVHPLAMARQLAAALPGGRFVQVTAKALDRSAHAGEVRAAITAFLRDHSP